MTQVLKLVRSGCFPGYLVFNGDTSSVGCGSGASIDDLHDAAVTWEAWVYPTSAGEANQGQIVCKPNVFSHWGLGIYAADGRIWARIECATTDAESISAGALAFNAWSHVAMTWDDGGARTIRLWVNGAEVTYTTQTAGVGAIVSDAAQLLFVGNNGAGGRGFAGRIGWVRGSSVERYAAGFTPPARCALPIVDANTKLQAIYEGEGTTTYDLSGNDNDGAIADCTWGCDCIDTELDLQDPDGLCVVDTGEGLSFVPGIPIPVHGRLPSRLTDEFDCWVVGTDHDDIASKAQKLDDYRVAADDYVRTRTAEHPVWLHAKLNNETSERRGLVRRIAAQWQDPHTGLGRARSAGFIDNKPMLRIGLQREPYWEAISTDVRDLPQASPTAAAAVKYDYTAAGAACAARDPTGDAAARIRLFEVRPVSSTDFLRHLWMGFRSANKHGAVDAFENIWECELGSTGTNAVLAADATASPGGGGNTKVTVTPGTATWARRLTLTLDDVTNQFREQLGRFLWLLRMRSDAATTWQVQCYYSYSGLINYSVGPIVPVTTYWSYHEMGIASIPHRDLQAILRSDHAVSTERAWTIQVYARRTSGTGILHLDCFCPIPLDEGWINVGLPTNIAGPSEIPEQRLLIAESPVGTWNSLVYDATNDRNEEPRPHTVAENFRIPPGDGRLFIVYQGTQSVLSYSMRFNDSDRGKYYERWHSLRGSE